MSYYTLIAPDLVRMHNQELYREAANARLAAELRPRHTNPPTSAPSPLARIPSLKVLTLRWTSRSNRPAAA